MELTPEIRTQLLVFQRTEITEHHIYKRLARAIKSTDRSPRTNRSVSASSK